MLAKKKLKKKKKPTDKLKTSFLKWKKSKKIKRIRLRHFNKTI